MKISVEILELIKRYVNDQLNDEERASLEQMISENPELQEEVDMARMLVKETGKAEEERLMEVIQEAHSEDSGIDPVKKINPSVIRRRRLIFTAVAAVLAILFYFIWGMQGVSKEEDINKFLADQYIEPVNTDLNRGSSSTTLLDNAFREFSNKDYAKSIETINTISEQDSNFLSALYLKGHNYIQLKSSGEAFEAFNNILKNENASTYFSTGLDKIKWYRIHALTIDYLSDKTRSKENELKQIISDFLKEANESDIYHSKAKGLLELLD